MDDFSEEYKEDPEGWNFWITESDEFYDIYLTHHDEAFFIKLDSIYTNNPIGIGKKIKTEEDQVKKEMPNYGFRKFTKEEIKSFFDSLPQSKKELERKQKKAKKVIQSKMKKSPSSDSPKEGEAMILGPYREGDPFNYKSDEQKDIDKKLRRKLAKKFRKKYPMYG